MILFFDTETTGKADFRAEPNAPHQPRLVQFAALLCEDGGEEVSSASLVIKPDGFKIPAEAAGVHGITTERALATGVDCSVARHIYRRWWAYSKLVVAHNIDFDLLIMDGELYRAAGGVNAWGDPREMFCTMNAMTPICKLPSVNGYSDYKWPKLQEAYKHAFGKEFEGAHDALADVRACASIYFWLQKQRQPITA